MLSPPFSFTPEQVKHLSHLFHQNYAVTHFEKGTQSFTKPHTWPPQGNNWYASRMADNFPLLTVTHKFATNALSLEEKLSLLEYAYTTTTEHAAEALLTKYHMAQRACMRLIYIDFHLHIPDVEVAKIFKATHFDLTNLPSHLEGRSAEERKMNLFKVFRHSFASAQPIEHTKTISDPILHIISALFASVGTLKRLETQFSSGTAHHIETLPLELSQTEINERTAFFQLFKEQIKRTIQENPDVLTHVLTDTKFDFQARMGCFTIYDLYCEQKNQKLRQNNQENLLLLQSMNSALKTLIPHFASDHMMENKARKTQVEIEERILNMAALIDQENFLMGWRRAFGAHTKSTGPLAYGDGTPQQAWRKTPLFIAALLSPANIIRGITYPFYHLMNKAWRVYEDEDKAAHPGSRALGFIGAVLLSPFALIHKIMEPLANSYIQAIQYSLFPALPGESRPWWKRGLALIASVGIVGLSIACFVAPPVAIFVKATTLITPATHFLAAHLSTTAFTGVSLGIQIVTPAALLSVASTLLFGLQLLGSEIKKGWCKLRSTKHLENVKPEEPAQGQPKRPRSMTAERATSPPKFATTYQSQPDTSRAARVAQVRGLAPVLPPPLPGAIHDTSRTEFSNQTQPFRGAAFSNRSDSTPPLEKGNHRTLSQ